MDVADNSSSVKNSDNAGVSSAVTNQMQSQQQSQLQKSPLLHAWYDPLSNLKTSSTCIRLADLACDGDYKLCLCDFEKKLKVFKGTSLISDYAILDVPISMRVTYTEATMPRIPSIAIAAGPHVFIYRQLRPYRKWSCPPVELSKTETDIWTELKAGTLSGNDAVAQLAEAREKGTFLSSRSIDLLCMENDPMRQAFIEEMKESPSFLQLTIITCMDIMKRDSEDLDATTLLVVGTEAGQLLILSQDPSNSAYLCKIQLPSTPSMLSVAGLFDVEWRISVVCRDGKMYNVKNGDARGSAVLSGVVVDLGAQAVALAKQDKYIWVATMEKTVTCYSNRGKRLKGIVMAEDVVEMTVMSLKRSKVNYILFVALATGEICLYRDLTVVYSLRVEKPITAMICGTYGREENSLVIVHGQGALTIKIWRRTAEVDQFATQTGPPPEQDIPLAVPKKTKLYVEQTQRERDMAPEIHRRFQRDLCKLRLTTARAYVKTLTDGYMSSSPLGSQDIRVNVQVQGLGPRFLLKITFQNATALPIIQSRVLFSFDSNLYVMGHDQSSCQSILVPILIPSVKHIVETQVLSIDPQGRAGQLLLMLLPQPGDGTSNGVVEASANNLTVPLLSASIRMPVSEPLL